MLGWTENASGARPLTSALAGVPAADLTPDDARTAWPSLVATIKALHELPVDDCPFERRLEGMLALATEIVADGAVETAFLPPEQRGRPHAERLAEVMADQALRLAQEAADLVVCHGDACLPNLLVDPETLECTGILDLGRLGLAGPARRPLPRARQRLRRCLQ